MVLSYYNAGAKPRLMLLLGAIGRIRIAISEPASAIC